MTELYAPFFDLPGARTAFLGLWALVLVVCLPFCWGWEDHHVLGDSDVVADGRERFSAGPAFLALAFPLWPLVVIALPLALLALWVALELGPRIARWWDADWSRG